jgi:hypothetical protein
MSIIFSTIFVAVVFIGIILWAYLLGGMEEFWFNNKNKK